MLYAIIPAAGIGSRMQSSIPKQYLPLLDGNVLLYSIRALLTLTDIKTLMIALAPHDRWWPQTEALLRPEERCRIQTCDGGGERWQSVQAALSALSDQVDHNADSTEHWVVVHDAVRPCVRTADLEALLHSCMPVGRAASTSHNHYAGDGALLASPVSDTLKKADATLKVVNTVDRSQLWAACTPQLFNMAVLQQALMRAADAGVAVTDDASAMEFCGFQPALVPCAKDNIKITYPEDLNLAALILQARR